jgi:DNA polymerase-3 subunit alpha
MAAAYRPGPMKYIPDYILCKHGQKDPEFLVPELEEIVGYTYGFAIYQEQVIKIAVDLGGYSMGGADILRRAMGKKKMDVMKKEEPIFKKGITDKGYSEEIADRLWEYLLPFADYGFNKAHAAGYAVLAYKCAYLKAHYPLEFVTALMHADLENADRIVVDIIEAKRLGFSVLKPDINVSDVYFKPEGESGIRFGLGAIKNVGVKVCQLIIDERIANGKYKHLDDLVNRVGLKNINKRTAEALIKSGALDEFGHRNELLTILPQVFEKASKAQKAESLGQADLFSLMSDLEGNKVEVQQTPFPKVEEVSDKQILTWEKELMGMYISHHPLQSFVWANLNQSFKRTNEVEELSSGKKVSMLGMFSQIKIVKTKAKAERMAVLAIEDLNGTCNAVIFPRQFKKMEELGLVEESRPYIITGTVNIKDGQHSVIINEIEPANSVQPPRNFSIDLREVTDTTELTNIKKYLVDKNKEDFSKVSIVYGSKKNPKTLIRYVDVQNEEAVRVLSSFVSKDN